MQLGPFVLCPPLRSEDKLSSHFLLLHHRCWPSFNSAYEAAQRHLSLPPDNSTLRFQPSRHQMVFSGALMLRNARKKSQKAVKTRALLGVLLKSCYVKRETMHGLADTRRVLLRNQNEGPPHTHLLHVTNATGVCHTRVAPSHQFCSSQSDILTCCLSVFDNALAPGR